MTLTDSETRAVVEVAGLAPSVHNTQPWRFVAAGHSLQVRADTDRMLRFLDPTARQLHISCGAAVEFARLAIRGLGRECVVRLRAGGADDPALLATLTVGNPAPVTEQEQRWLDAIPRRYTDRGHYDPVPLPADLLAKATDAAASLGCWLRVLDRPGERTTASTLLSHAEQIETTESRYREEIVAWRRQSPAEDGIPAAATAWDDEAWVSDVPLRDYTGGGHHREPGGGPPPQVERDTLVLLGSADDTPSGWLRTGRALSLVLLTLTDAGVVTQPLGPVTDLPTTRLRLQHELGLLGHPQLLLRAGYGHGRPRTGRRSVEEMLAVAAVG